MSKKWLIMTLTAFAVIIIAYEWIPLQVSRGILGYSLIVDVSIDGPKPQRYYAVTFFQREDAESALRDYETINPKDREDRVQEFQPIDSEPIEVDIRGSDRVSPFGRTIVRIQENHLIVIAEWPDGHRRFKLVEIPDGRTSRRISIALP